MPSESVGAVKFRVVIYIRHLTQALAACLTAMSRGNLRTITWEHWQFALTTGLWAGFVAVILSFGKLRVIQTNRWGVAATAVAGTSLGDFLTHPSHFGGPMTEAAVTGLGAGILCLLFSYTPAGAAIDKLGKVSSDSKGLYKDAGAHLRNPHLDVDAD